MSFHNVKLESSSTILRLTGPNMHHITNCLFGQCELCWITHHYTDLHPGISSWVSSVRSHRDFMLWALHLGAGFHLGLARPLSWQSVFLINGTDSPTDTFPRVTTAPGGARHGITIEGPTGPSLGFPVPGCLARGHPQL
jgi:hypothetical protein